MAKTAPGRASPDSRDGSDAPLYDIAVKDVWSRSDRRHRVRAVVLLAINVLLFAGVGSFAYWLRTGLRFAPAHEGYWDVLKQTFWSVPVAGNTDSSASLGALLLEPISVQHVPMQIPILGLLMAALIAIPILVSALYRFWSSLPFIAVVGLIAVMPWLAVTLFVSCLLASGRLIQTRFRFVSALLGLVPAVIYLILAYGGTTEAVAGKIDPVDRIKFIAPWVLAIVAAAAVFAIVLAISKLVDYRPGAIASLLAVMFGLPVALFEAYVGRDELYYRLLEARNNAYFADEDASVELEQAVMEAWLRHPHPRPSMKAVWETVETRWLFELASDVRPVRSALVRHQAELAARCDWFLKYFPESRYAPSALFIKARALDMRVDPAEFRRSRWIRFYDSFPSPTSAETWRMLVANRPKSTLGAVALLRLAQLDAREGDVERAIDKLDTALHWLETDSQASRPSHVTGGPLSRALARQSPEASLLIRTDRIVLEAQRLKDLLKANRDPLYSYDPLAGPQHPGEHLPFGLLDLEPRHELYIQNLEKLKRQYPHCQIEDNIDLELAKATMDPNLRIQRLEACIQDFPEGDAAAEALFRLAVAYKQNGHGPKSVEAFTQLEARHGESIWARQARFYALPQTALSVPSGSSRTLGQAPG